MIIDLTDAELAAVATMIDASEPIADTIYAKVRAAMAGASPSARSYRLLYAALESEAYFQDWEHAEVCDRYEDEAADCTCNWAATEQALRVGRPFAIACGMAGPNGITQLRKGDADPRPDDPPKDDEGNPAVALLDGQVVAAISEPGVFVATSPLADAIRQSASDGKPIRAVEPTNAAGARIEPTRLDERD